jgi:hypothetical protein
MTDQQRADNLMRRTDRLRLFVQTFEGRWNSIVEAAAYGVLEVYQSRPRVIWNYIRYAVERWWLYLLIDFEFRCRFLWYRRMKGYSKEAAIEKACDAIDKKLYEAFREETNND